MPPQIPEEVLARVAAEAEAAKIPVPITPVVSAELPQYKDLAYQAAGLSGDTKTADYIRELASGKYGEADTRNAFATLIEEGRLRNEAAAAADTDEDDEGSNTVVTKVTDPAATLLAQSRVNAFSRLKVTLKKLNLSSLEDAIKTIISSGTVDLDDGNALIFALRDEEAYIQRFKGNIARQKKNLPELDPQTYLDLEEKYRDLLRANNLPQDFYDSQEDFVKFIEADISPSELQQRVEKGFAAVDNADPEVLKSMRALYPEIGNDRAMLAAFYLDPTKATPLLILRTEAAKIARVAKQRGNLGAGDIAALGASGFENFAQQGLSEAQIEQGFGAYNLQKGLFDEMSGEQSFTLQQKVGAALGTDINTLSGIERRKSLRKGVFQGGGKFASTTGQTSGTIESGLNRAQ